MKQNRFWFRGRGGVRSRSRMFGRRCMRRTRRRFLRGSRAECSRCCSWPRSRRARPDCVVGRVRRRMDRCDALQQLTRLVEAGQHLGVVESGVVRDDCDLLCLGFALKPFQREDRLLGVPVPLDRVQLDLLADQRERTEERLGRLPPVHGPAWCAVLSGAACGGSRPRAPSAPQSCGVDLPAGVQQGLDLGRRLGHASGGGRLVAALVERVRAARGSAPHRRRSSRYEESDWCSASNRILTTSRIAGTSQNSA